MKLSTPSYMITAVLSSYTWLVFTFLFLWLDQLTFFRCEWDGRTNYWPLPKLADISQFKPSNWYLRVTKSLYGSRFILIGHCAKFDNNLMMAKLCIVPISASIFSTISVSIQQVTTLWQLLPDKTILLKNFHTTHCSNLFFFQPVEL